MMCVSLICQSGLILFISCHHLQVIPQERFYSSVKKHGLGLTIECMGMTSLSDDIAQDTWISPTGEVRTVPDLSTKCRVPWYYLETYALMLDIFHCFKLTCAVDSLYIFYVKSYMRR